MSKFIFKLFVLFIVDVLFDELPLQKYPLEVVGHRSILCVKCFFSLAPLKASDYLIMQNTWSD